MRRFGTALPRLWPRFSTGSAGTAGNGRSVPPSAPQNVVPAVTPPIDPPSKCTVFDERGRVTSVAANLDRKQFLKENGSHSRDLRHIDGPQRSSVPYIQVQKGNNMSINICDLRVLIKSNEVLVFHSRDPAIAERLSMSVYDFTAKLGKRNSKMGKASDKFGTGQDYEQVALEVVLIHAVAYSEVELNLILNRVRGVLRKLDYESSYEHLKDLSRYSTDLKFYFRRSMAVRRALDDASDDSSGLSDMYLTDSSRGKNPTDYNDIEILLETYYSQADELVQKAGQMVREVEMTEEIMTMVIDANRNSLILFRLEISVLTVGLAFATFLADLYGMNLENFIEEDAWGMPVASAVIAAMAIVGTAFNFKRSAATKRVFMPQSPTKRTAYREQRQASQSWLKNAKDPQ